MIRGTTPTHTFTLPFDTSMISKLRVIYQQSDRTVLVKTEKDCTMEGNTISYKLTQAETLRFDSNTTVEIQIRVLTETGEALVSRVHKTSVGICLENDVLK